MVLLLYSTLDGLVWGNVLERGLVGGEGVARGQMGEAGVHGGWTRRGARRAGERKTWGLGPSRPSRRRESVPLTSGKELSRAYRRCWPISLTFGIQLDPFGRMRGMELDWCGLWYLWGGRGVRRDTSSRCGGFACGGVELGASVSCCVVCAVYLGCVRGSRRFGTGVTELKYELEMGGGKAEVVARRRRERDVRSWAWVGVDPVRYGWGCA